MSGTRKGSSGRLSSALRRRGARWAAVAIAGCLAIAGGSLHTLAQAAELGEPLSGVPHAPAAAPTEAADAATAMSWAQKYRLPVEITGERTESSQTFAQPDGSYRTTQSATPVRVRHGSSWVSVDPTLRIVDGAVVPAASTLDMRFSAGGSAPLLTIAGMGRSLSLLWPRPLPAPILLGDTATYPEVLPGVDLRMTAAVDAFSEVLVVKTAEAARNPQLASLPFGLTTSGVTLSHDADTGFIKAVDPMGAAVFVSDGAHMWDSTPAPARARSASSVGELVSDVRPARAEDVPVQLSARTLTVVPSLDMLTGPDTRFPLYIDPGFNGGKEIWTPVNRKNPGKSYWTDDSWRDTMRVGQSWDSSSDDDWRTLVQFDVRPLRDTKILSAKVVVDVWHTANCTASPFQLWQTEGISKSAAVTWNNTKDRWWKQLAEVNATANKQSCPKSDDQVSFGQAAVVDAFQAATAYDSITFVFRAKSETDQMQWKKLKADSTFLDINYNRRPGTPAGLSLSPCFQACSGALATSSRQPTLTMRAADPDGGNLRYEYEVYDSAKTTPKAASHSDVVGVASNALRGWSVRPALPDGQYFWRGRACDVYLCGPYSGWVGFMVDATNPALPSVESDVYRPTGWNGGPGVPARFTTRPGAAGDGVSLYTYALNDSPAIRVSAGSDGVGWETMTPTRDMDNVLHVVAYDRAGNQSNAVDYQFRVKPIGDVWYWSLDETAGTEAASAPKNNRPAGITGSGVSWNGGSAQGQTGGSATFAGQGEFTTTAPVLNTTDQAGFTIAAWVRIPGSEPDHSTDDPGEGLPLPDADSGGVVPDLPPARNQTAVSEEGTATSMFRLGYRNDLDADGDGVVDPAWCMSVQATDNAAASGPAACSRADVTPGRWTHLVGMVDQAKNQISLYVNGLEASNGTQVTVAGSATWEATGKFAIGRGGTAAAPVERWVGGIDEVYAVPRLWSDQEIDQHAYSSAVHAKSVGTP